MKEIEMTLPRFGYTVIRREKKIDRDRATEYLTPKRQRKITKAVLGDQTVTVEQTTIRCPRCGRDTPAYADFLGQTETDEPFQKVPVQRIAEWVDRQLRLFSGKRKEYRFQKPVLPPKRFICPICRMASRGSEGTICVRVRSERKKVIISLALGIEDLFAIPWLPSLQIGNEELYETVTFHLRKHRVYLTVEDKNGVRYATHDISDEPIEKIADEPVLKAFRFYKPVSRAVKRFFIELYGGEIPYFAVAWCLENCFFLTNAFGHLNY